MKKLTYAMLAGILALGITACAEDDSGSTPPPSPETTETINKETKLGEEKEHTITLTNPYGVEAELDVSFHNSYNSLFTFDAAKSTCPIKITEGSNIYFTTTLKANESCTVVYKFKPTKFNTELLQMEAQYDITKSLCPTADTVPSYNQMVSANKFVKMYVYNYVLDKDGNKSPEYVNVTIDTEYSVSSMYQNQHTVSADFNLPAKKGEYDFYNATLSSNNTDCEVTGDTLSVKGDKGCSLKITVARYASHIQFRPKVDTNPYYNVSVDVNSQYNYYILTPNNEYSHAFQPKYYATQNSENTYFYVAELKDNAKVTKFEITGTDKGKFSVAETKYNGCTIKDNTISIPAGQKRCFWTVELTDKSTDGTFNAEVNTILSTGATENYKIEGQVDTMTIDEMLQTVCQQMHQNPATLKLIK